MMCERDAGFAFTGCAIIFLFMILVATFIFWWPLLAYSVRYWFP